MKVAQFKRRIWKSISAPTTVKVVRVRDQVVVAERVSLVEAKAMVDKAVRSKKARLEIIR